ncbi:MAG TPA: hypothetical protein VMS31_09645, partial [Pyrinomonadaceae bacterium]|nr:hypothetical protein [Pyrinomonadaceae bacterium]
MFSQKKEASASTTRAGVIKQPSWKLPYLALAAFGLLAVGLSLYLGHMLIETHTAATITNKQLSAQMAEYSELRRLAMAVNAPGNDIFTTRDVTAESRKTVEALAEFKQAFDHARNSLFN